jgi:hypothetical protein
MCLTRRWTTGSEKIRLPNHWLQHTAANDCACSAGGTWPIALCGRTVLYSTRHASILHRASARLKNQNAFRHSCRTRLLKPSANALSVGLPDASSPARRRTASPTGRDRETRTRVRCRPGYALAAHTRVRLLPAWRQRCDPRRHVLEIEGLVTSAPHLCRGKPPCDRRFA